MAMPNNTPELWGGLECSYTRVEGSYADQLDYCGHYRRGILDIQYIARLGIKALRYPVIFERYHDPEDLSWSWLARQLNVLRYYDIKPIAGLLHHGSGPIHASLNDPCFPAELQKFARRVAETFPWLEYFTPINEPLTTARFCGLYGFWYPHFNDAKSFAEILLNEMKAVVLAMQAIRKVIPNAKLIQTEDLGKTYSTPRLQYQADFENERRWLTNDLLCGFVKPGHAMWDYFLWLGIPKRSLEFFLQNPCPPQIMGWDYYITSERFLDETPDKYPSHTYGSNGKIRYADVEAIRVNHPEKHGPEVLLKESWERYKIPLAITEIHIHGAPEEQIAWFSYIWKACLQLKDEGVDIRAATAWAMFGSYGWSKLLTENPGEYERGVFDVSSGRPVATPYTDFLMRLAREAKLSHPPVGGWWERSERFLFDEMLR
jgi:dTDP-4-dehydrorhamnose reductase